MILMIRTLEILYSRKDWDCPGHDIDGSACKEGSEDSKQFNYQITVINMLVHEI